MQMNLTTMQGIAAEAVLPTEPANEPAADATPSLDEPKKPSVTLQDTALNGAQVTALLQILASISAGALDKEAAVTLITSAFPAITEPEAQQIVEGALLTPAAPVNSPVGDVVAAQKSEPPSTAPAPRARRNTQKKK
jgi:hypothetical protein